MYDIILTLRTPPRKVHLQAVINSPTEDSGWRLWRQTRGWGKPGGDDTGRDQDVMNGERSQGREESRRRHVEAQCTAKTKDHSKVEGGRSQREELERW